MWPFKDTKPEPDPLKKAQVIHDKQVRQRLWHDTRGMLADLGCSSVATHTEVDRAIFRRLKALEEMFFQQSEQRK